MSSDEESPGLVGYWVAVNEAKKEVMRHVSRRVLEETLKPFEKVGRVYRYEIDYRWE